MLPSVHAQEQLTPESKERTKGTLQKILLMILVIPTATSFIFFFMNLAVVHDAFSNLPPDFHKMRIACAGEDLNQAAVRLDVCKYMISLHLQCLEWAKRQPGNEDLDQAIESCDKGYQTDLEESRSEILWWPRFFLIASLCMTASAILCGYMGIQKDDPSLMRLYSMWSTVSLPLYAGACVLCCQFYLVVHIALYASGAYFGFVYYHKQTKMVEIPSPPSAQLQANQPQPSAA